MHSIQLWELACQRWRPDSRPSLQLNTLNPTVGASLLAKAVCQSPEVLEVLTPSRAGSLSQGFSCVLLAG
ncbi:hypothetical protein F7R05_02875 [Pseudomonas koreensis]|nr:hypothetical protein F7R05_02875 [Pseudomonas koreensis]